MDVGVVGVNYQSASLSIREKIDKRCRELQLSHQVVVSTCHRTEIYFSHPELTQMRDHLLLELKKELSHGPDDFFYSYFEKECFFHLACVTAGLDSAVLAESDVQRQVKLAYKQASLLGKLPSPLHFIFQKGLHLGKQVRSSFSLFQSSLRLEGMLQQMTLPFTGRDGRLLFVGNSDINRKIIRYFAKRGRRNLTLCTRYTAASASFAIDYGISLQDRSAAALWHTYDGVIVATTAPSFLITPQEKDVQTRLIVDLSMPRNVHPSLQGHPQLTLFNLEDISRRFSEHHSKYATQVKSIQGYLEHAVCQHAHTYARRSRPLITT